jgi:hypothetical protein
MIFLPVMANYILNACFFKKIIQKYLEGQRLNAYLRGDLFSDLIVFRITVAVVSIVLSG